MLDKAAKLAQIVMAFGILVTIIVSYLTYIEVSQTRPKIDTEIQPYNPWSWKELNETNVYFRLDIYNGGDAPCFNAKLRIMTDPKLDISVDKYTLFHNFVRGGLEQKNLMEYFKANMTRDIKKSYDPLENRKENEDIFWLYYIEPQEIQTFYITLFRIDVDDRIKKIDDFALYLTCENLESPVKITDKSRYEARVGNLN